MLFIFYLFFFSCCLFGHITRVALLFSPHPTNQPTKPPPIFPRVQNKTYLSHHKQKQTKKQVGGVPLCFQCALCCYSGIPRPPPPSPSLPPLFPLPIDPLPPSFPLFRLQSGVSCHRMLSRVFIFYFFLLFVPFLCGCLCKLCTIMLFFLYTASLLYLFLLSSFFFLLSPSSLQEKGVFSHHTDFYLVLPSLPPPSPASFLPPAFFLVVPVRKIHYGALLANRRESV